MMKYQVVEIVDGEERAVYPSKDDFFDCAYNACKLANELNLFTDSENYLVREIKVS